MTRENSRFWWWWLLIVTDGVILFSLALIVLPEAMLRFFNVLFFSTNEGSSLFGVFEADYLIFIYSVLGAVMIGWATTMFFVLMGSFKRGEKEGWYALAVSLTVWFVVDCTVSVLNGFTPNAFFNLIFYVLYAIPLAATYKQFFMTQQEDAVRPHPRPH